MPGKGHSQDQVLNKLRQVEVAVASGKSVGKAVHGIGVTDHTCCRWRQEYNTIRPHSSLGYLRPPFSQYKLGCLRKRVERAIGNSGCTCRVLGSDGGRGRVCLHFDPDVQEQHASSQKANDGQRQRTPNGREVEIQKYRLKITSTPFGNQSS